MKVSNPLTIIAIFSGLAETLATVALINLPQELQGVFVYFVMVFPFTIVVLFFLILYFKNTVLYAPSDYSNPDHYMRINHNISDVVSSEIEEIHENMETEKDGDNAVAIEKRAMEMATAATSKLLNPTLEILIVQLLGKPLSERNDIISSIENENIKKMIVSILSKIEESE